MQRAISGKGAFHVSEPQLNESVQRESNVRTILFMVALSFICASILSILASVLAEPKEIAKDLDRSRQMLIAGQVLSHDGHFQLLENGKYVPAKYTRNGLLTPSESQVVATNTQILDVYKQRFIPLLVDNKGDLTTFEKTGMNLDTYIKENKKIGYYKQPYKLLYAILPNTATHKIDNGIPTESDGYVIPVNGFGLWDAIYGYLAIKPDADTVIGVTWYDQKETPGLGANISEAYWQNLFPGKKIFQVSPNGKTDFKSAPIGIVVVKGKVSEVYGDSPKAKSAVDGMAGATLTGNGVTDAYRDVLTAYRPFLLKLHQEYETKSGTP